MGDKLNLVGSQLVLKVVTGEITSEEACRQLNSDKQPPPCVRGPYGVCVTHGQLLSDCEEDGC